MIIYVGVGTADVVVAFMKVSVGASFIQGDMRRYLPKKGC
jgi:hypothetical protein